jgi:hypothetical protein
MSADEQNRKRMKSTIIANPICNTELQRLIQNKQNE